MHSERAHLELRMSDPHATTVNHRRYEHSHSLSDIDVASGYPREDLIPTKEIQEAFAKALCSATLTYGEDFGSSFFRSAVPNFLRVQDQAGSAAFEVDNFVATFGVSGALDLICTILFREGDTILVEEPTYPYALPIFRDHMLNIVSVPLREDGLDLERLESLCRSISPRAFYCIPTHHNPTGTTLSTVQRAHLIQMAQHYNFLILADETYQFLSFDHYVPPPAMVHLDDGQRSVVVGLGSFSKTLAPSLRMGYVWSRRRDIITALGKAGLFQSGSNNNLTASVVARILASGAQLNILDRLQHTYAELKRHLCNEIRQNLGSFVSFEEPKGGYFVWLKLREDLPNSDRICRDAKEHVHLSMTPGTICVADPLDKCRVGARHLRLCFTNNTKDNFHQAVMRMKKLFEHYEKHALHERILFHDLQPTDAEVLITFYSNLSVDSQRHFTPHQFDDAFELQKLIARDNHMKIARLGAWHGHSIVGYCIVNFDIPQSVVQRFKSVGESLDPDKDCLIAPAVLDTHHGTGISNEIIKRAFEKAYQLRKSKVVLMGGVRDTNMRAISFYRKLGFRHVSTFIADGAKWLDMVLDL